MAAQLWISVCWCVPEYKSRWKENTAGTVTIQASLGDKRLIKKLMETGNKWIHLTLKIWWNVITSNNMIEDVKIMRWCCYNRDLTPDKMDTNLKRWTNLGLSSYCTF